MPPSPGKIQPLPVKVLYTIDTAPQSFVSVLPERQDVYVHPSPLSDELAGSCALRPVARGICFSSPECTPSSALDFSLYSLDPSQSWSGKGFLSWLLAEASSSSSSSSGPSSSSTLIRGRIVRAYEFAPTSFSENGLEGLVAAAQAGETDGKGWGLEVTVTLRQVNPEGKQEFSARGAFATMLASGKSTATAPLAVAPRPASSPARPAPVPAQPRPAHANSAHPAHAARPAPPTQHAQTAPVIPQLSKPRPPYVPPKPPLPAPPARARSSVSTGSRLASSPVITPSSLSQPSSSTPVPPTSASLQPSSGPSRSSSAAPPPAAAKIEPRRTPSIPPPPAPAPAPARASTPPRARPVTPPPRARQTTPPRSRHKTPPPPSPSRAALLNMLSNDGKMSPELARKLADNTFLLKLFKSVPAAKALVNGQVAGAAGIAGQAGPSSVGAPAATNGHAGMGAHGPSALGRNGSTPVNSARDTREGSPTPRQADVCCNCGAVKSDQWMTKKVKDGTPKKVCNPCGIYFNKHKRMRPRDLWEAHASSPAIPSAPAATHHTRSHSVAGTPAASAGTPQPSTQPLPARSPALAASAQFAPHAPVRSSPRLHRGDRPERSLAADIFESPRKKQKTRHAPPPSPRMATRARARSDDGGYGDGGEADGAGQLGPGAPASDGPLGSHPSSYAFSPASLFGTSPAIADETDMDIDALLAQFTAGAPPAQNGVPGSAGGAGSHVAELAYAHAHVHAHAPALALDPEAFAGLGSLDGINLEALAGLENDPTIMEMLAAIEREQAELDAAAAAAAAAGGAGGGAAGEGPGAGDGAGAGSLVDAAQAGAGAP